jgi:hypothetical protein
MNFFICGLVETLPKLLFVVVILISTLSLVLIVLLLPLTHGFSSVYIKEYIPKYNSIKKFINFPFQWVLIHLIRNTYEGVMAVSLQLCLLYKSGRATIGDLAISACRNFRLT